MIERLHSFVQREVEALKNTKTLLRARHAWRRAGLYVAKTDHVYLLNQDQDGFSVLQANNAQINLKYRRADDYHGEIIQAERKVVIDPQTWVYLSAQLEKGRAPMIKLSFERITPESTEVCHGIFLDFDNPQSRLWTASWLLPYIPDVSLDLRRTLKALTDPRPNEKRPLIPLIAKY